MASRGIACESRVAWLLATSRMLHPDPDLVHRENFVAALKARGVPVDNTRISRWESGAQSANDQVLTAYEHVLNLAPSTLVSVVGGLRRSFGPAYGVRPVDVATLDSTDLDRLLDGVSGGQVTHGGRWQALADEVTRYERVYLRQQEWATLCNQLVRELSRSVGLAYVRRYEAAATLIRHPSAQRHLSRALGSFVMHPDTQVVAPVLNILTEVGDQAVSDLVLRMMSGESRGLRRAASSVAAAKLRLGHIPDSSLKQLEAYASRTMRRGEPLDGALDAFDLAMQLPSDSFVRVMETISDRRIQAQLGRARSTGELLTRQQAAAVIADLGADIQTDVEGDTGRRRDPEPDMMLRRLVRESLFHTHKARRHQAGLVLAASPYRNAVARQCQVLTGGSNYFLAARAWTVMMRVGHAGNRGNILLRAMTESRPTLQSRALVNLGLSREGVSRGEARAILAQVDESSRASVRHGAFFALGMSGAPEIKALGKHDDEGFRRTAAWWKEQGPAIHDVEVFEHA